jgi:DNA polymerase III delta subunit
LATCYSNQLEATLRQSLPAVVLLYGDDAGAIRQGARQVVAASGVDAADPFLSEKLTLPDLADHPSRLPDSASTLTLTGGCRLIQLTAVAGDERKDLVDALTAAVKATLELPLADVCIVLPVPRLLDKSSALVKTVEAHPQGLGVRFFLPSQRDLAGWLQNEFSAAGKRVEPEAMAILTDSLGADREQARREVEKLLLYVGAAETVAPDDVRASLSGAIPADVFRLAEAVASRNTRQADRLIRLLLEEGEDLNSAFSVTLTHLTKLRAAQTLRRDGKPDDALLLAAGKAKAPPQARTDYLHQVKTYPAARLATLPAYALETLAAARGGVLDGNLVLSRALLALAA